MPNLIVTNSSLSTFRACPRLYQLKYVDGYRPVENGEDLELGTAMHYALESWWTDGDYDWAAARLAEKLTGLQLGKALTLMAGYHHRWLEDRALYEVIGLEVPFSFRMPGMHGVRAAGKIDGIVRRLSDDTIWIVEHKTTSSELAPGSTYWQRLGMDSQISMYFDGAKSLGHDIAGCLYDVIGKPKLRGRQNETPEQLGARVAEEIIAAPERYYQRSEIVRFEQELDESRADVIQTTRLLRSGHKPRNVDSCLKYGNAKPCVFIEVCSGTASLDDSSRFRHTDNVHPELT